MFFKENGTVVFFRKDPQHVTLEIKVKAIPVLAWTGPECFRRLRFPDFKKKALEGGKVVSPTRRPSLPPGNIPGTHFS
jgi:hypothetical protein